MGLVEADLGMKLKGEVFGWGVGGAEKMELIAQILHELGFKSVVGILDSNKAELVGPLQGRFPGYRFLTLPAEDIRTKPGRKASNAVVGLLDDTNTSVRAEYVEATELMIDSINQYLT